MWNFEYPPIVQFVEKRKCAFNFFFPSFVEQENPVDFSP